MVRIWKVRYGCMDRERMDGKDMEHTVRIGVQLSGGLKDNVA